MATIESAIPSQRKRSNIQWGRVLPGAVLSEVAVILSDLFEPVLRKAFEGLQPSTIRRSRRIVLFQQTHTSQSSTTAEAHHRARRPKVLFKRDTRDVLVLEERGRSIRRTGSFMESAGLIATITGFLCRCW